MITGSKEANLRPSAKKSDKNTQKGTKEKAATTDWKALIQCLPNEIFILNKKGIITEANHKNKKQTLFTGKPFTSIIPSKSHKNGLKHFKECLKNKTHQEFVTETNTKHAIQYYKNKLIPLLNQGAITGCLLEITDCTKDILQIKKQANDIETKYQNCLYQLPNAVVVYDGLKLVFVNEAALKLFEIAKADALFQTGKKIFNYFPKAYSAYLQKAKKSIPVSSVEFKIITPSGNVLVLEVKPHKIIFNGKEALQIIFNDITHQKKVENTIIESERKILDIVKNINELVYYVEFLPTEKKVKYLGKQVETIFGISLKEYEKKGKKLWKLIPEEDVILLERALFEAKKTRKPQEVKYRFFHSQKKTHLWLQERIIPQVNESGKHIGNIGLIRDITPQVDYEDQLKEEKRMAQNYLDVASVVLVVINKAQQVTLINRMGCQLLGYKEKEILGKNWFDHFVPKEVKTKMKTDFIKRIQGKHLQDTQQKSEIVLKNGKRRIISWKSSIIYDKTGKAISILSSGEDITEKRIAENKLKDSENRFRILANATVEGIVFTENERIVDTNEQFIQLFGFKKTNEVIGKNMIDLLIKKEERASVRQQIQAKQSNPIELKTVTQTGALLVVEAKSQTMPYFGRQLRVTVIYDITQRKKDQLELEKSREKYKMLIDSSPNGILIYCQDKLQFANKSALELLEASSFKALAAKKKLAFLLPEYKKEALYRVQRADKGDAPPFREVELKTLKGTILALQVKPIKVQYNGENAIQVILQDVNPQKQLIKEQLRAQIAEETTAKLQQEILEREQAERTLQQTQKYTQLLIESSLDIIFASDKEGFITEFNAAAEKIFGYNKAEVIGKHVSLLYPNSEKEIKTVYEQLYETGRYEGEVLNSKKDGRKFIAYLSASILKNNEGELLGAMGVSRDISEMKKAEQELRNSEERYRAIYDQVFVGIARMGLNGKFIQVNEQMCNMLGYSKEELCDRTLIDITVKEDIPATITIMKQMASNQMEKITFEKRYSHKTGKLINANVATSIVLDALGNPSHIIAIFQNITEKVKLEQDQQSQSARHNAIIESSSHIIWTTDKQMCLTSFNKNYADDLMQHYNVEAHIGLSVVSVKVVLTEEYNSYWLKKYEAVLRGEKQYFETKMIDKQNNVVWREIFLNPIFDERGNLVEIAGIGLDVTEKKLANERIQNSLQEKEVLLKEVHHRVKNNLQVISSILNLQSSYIKDKSTLDILKESQDRIKSMAFIHESLYQTKDFSSINFSEYVINLSQNLLQSYSSPNHEIKLNLDIQNVFLNLDQAIPCGLIINEIVSNALKYAFVDKKKNAEIMIKMYLVEENLHLQIRDNGVGLPKHIDYKNTESLGLQLVITLVDQLNGNIELDSTQGAFYNIEFKHNQVKKSH